MALEIIRARKETVHDGPLADGSVFDKPQIRITISDPTISMLKRLERIAVINRVLDLMPIPVRPVDGQFDKLIVSDFTDNEA